MHAIAAQSRKRMSDLSIEVPVDEAAVLFWCFWQCSLSDHLGLDLPLARVADTTECKTAWMACGWLREVRKELLLWHRLETFTTLRCILPLALRWWTWWGRGRDGGPIEGFGPGRYRKILAVLKHVEAEVKRGSVPSFLGVADSFAMNSEGAWLKVAGGDKAAVLEQSARNAKLSEGHVALECGSFIGYTAARLAAALRRRLGSSAEAQLVTIEGDPVHIAIARHFLDLVRVAGIVEVQPGMVRDVLPCIGESFSASATGFVFMDQKGTSFHRDHALLDRLGTLVRGASVIADNVVRPGAPVHVWATARALRAIAPTFWSLPEFLEESAGVEDWMALAWTPC